jgi:hypothetical protein
VHSANWVRPIRSIWRNGVDSDLAGIFPPGDAPNPCSHNQTLSKLGPTHPNPLQPVVQTHA